MMSERHTWEFNIKSIIFIILLFPGILFSIDIPGEVYLGDLKSYDTVEYSLELTNETSEVKSLTFLSLCDCLEIDPLSIDIDPNKTKIAKISLTPEGHKEISRHMIIDINGTKQPLKVYAKLPEAPVKVLSGGCPECKIKERQLAEKEAMKKELSNWVVADIYYSPGCKTCEKFLEETVPELEAENERNISINKKNILEAAELENLEKRLNKLDVEITRFPILIYNNMVIQGDDVNKNNFISLITAANRIEDSSGYKRLIEKVKPIPILLAGLIDGINPCAFTTLLFLISSLFYIGRGKKEILQIGIIFAITIFFSYYLVGLGLLNIIRTANFFPVVSTIIKYILILGLFILAALSFYDAVIAKSGVAREMKLQLPKSLKKRINSTIRKNTRKRGLITGTIIIGIMVTIFELACTGQIYLPIIAYIIKSEGSISAYGYLTIYNLGFIIPLLAVFILIYYGVTNQTVISWFQNRIAKIKIILGVLFLIMILVLLI